MWRTVGIRELKNKLSQYLRYVQQGDDVVVTDRGRIVAEIRAPGSPRNLPDYPRLVERAERGDARMGQPNRPDLYTLMGPVAGPPGLAALLLAEERGER